MHLFLFTETTYQLITIDPRCYKDVIIFLFSRKSQQKLITLLTISYSESAYPITPGQLLKPRFYEIS